ncbi:DNA mismatch repair protein [Clostridium estertheticum]|uniref:MutS-related protein n=1 Tax=Clostridium estertheticum TaxID=238834 RepID=UPI001C7D6625|nr:MutS family DNA mismatch repair protein [Clostridium estertheticum]MBX4258678.1 DNA mismatch repair protein [Clostridium estertheticum]WLC69852.1 DNA mismatch repair protein [Clostridium estertheticum]
MEKQKSSYANRKKHYEDLLKKQTQTISFISLLRLIIFVAGLGFSIFFYMRATYYLSAFLLITTLITFITLAIKHKKIKYNKIRCTILCEINENCLKRLDNNWKGFSDSGQDFVDETHSYSRDLDIFGDNSLFQWINTCITYLGRQKLKETLKKPKYNIEEIYKRQKAVKELAKNIGWTQRFEAEAILSENKNHDPEELFKWAEDKNEFFLKPIIIAVIRILPIITLSLLVSSFILSLISYKIFMLAIVLQIILLTIGYKEVSRNLDTVYQYKDSILIYNRLLKHIEKKKFDSEYLINLKEKLINKDGMKASTQIEKLANLVTVISDRKNIYYFPINILTLWDYQCLINLQRFKKASASSLNTWLEVIGEMEALNSLSTIAFEHSDWAMPKFQDSPPIFDAKKLGHPLLGDKRIYNDIHIDKSQNIILITGSNMSGKSTLLRTTGINLVLAYTGAPVCCESFTCSIMDIYTCMRTSDNLEKNISSFYAELLRIKKLVTATEDKTPIFFLLDEIFKGTNSIDRHTGAKVLVAKLSNENALGFVSTHDLELGDIEKTNRKVRNYHLREYYKDDKLYFDYKLRTGVSTTRNALYLMKMAGLEIPSDIDLPN